MIELRDLAIPTDMQIFVVPVTPALAEQWLARNTKNRNLKPTRVKLYADDMARGNWRLTHEGIAFDCHGALVDGQHRLRAVIKSGQTVLMLVVANVDERSMAVIGAAAARTDYDRIVIGGEIREATRRHITIAKSMNATNWAKRSLSTSEVCEFLRTHWDAVDFAARLVIGRGDVRGVTSSLVLAVMARAYYHVDRDDLTRFYECVYSGIIQGPHQTAAIRLRDALTVRLQRSNFNGTDRKYAYRLTENALNAFLLGRVVKRLVESPNELFPLPDENTD